MEDIQGGERDLRLRALRIHESLARSKADAVDRDGSASTPVTDDVDGRGPVYEVLGQSLESKLVRVLLDELMAAA